MCKKGETKKVEDNGATLILSVYYEDFSSIRISDHPWSHDSDTEAGWDLAQ